MSSSRASAPGQGHCCTETKSQWRRQEGTNNLTCELVTQQPQHQGAQHPLADTGALCTCKFKQFLSPGYQVCKVNPTCSQLGTLQNPQQVEGACGRTEGGAPRTCYGHCWDALITARPHIQAVRENGDEEGVFLTSCQLWCTLQPSPGTCTLYSMLCEQAMHQKLHLLLDALSL